ncbi:gliding motility-associated C-terminal domain-containing protein [Spongiimicrobium sp. 3-5]|uniref:gliding motility-associated C-terminal domain-containing protein n=1 Tax=Spongiimicrobium sp. 3-5 TaxID=3332596 RepID=UPI00397F3BDD
MKYLNHIALLFLIGNIGYAQTALYNSGNIRIHQNGQLGFHTDLINDASFDQNLGLAGFYGNTLVSVSGAFMPVFYDTEIANDAGVFLNTGITVTNNTNFVIGDVISPKNQLDVYFNFFRDAFYIGETNGSKVDGFAAITNKQVFSFPVGDSEQLRPLILNSQAENQFAKCAYFFEDANNPISLPNGFDTTRKIRDIGEISTLEFWKLEGSIPSTITINWNARSNMAAFTPDVQNITIVGYSKSANRWLSLGNTAIGGDITQGFVSSETFVPDDYEIITFGTLAVPQEILLLENYLLTPNGDGKNDFLVIPEMIELSPNNSIRIYDRNGLLVFEMTNYTDEFNGISNIDNRVIKRDIGLPQGMYFYLVSLDDLALNFQGFLYLAR